MDDCAYSVDYLRLLYEQFPTSEELAIPYAKGLFNLSAEQTLDDCAHSVDQLRQPLRILDRKFFTCCKLFIKQSQLVNNLTLKQESETLRQTIARLREFLLTYPGANQGFQDALDTYLNEHPDHTEHYAALRV